MIFFWCIQFQSSSFDFSSFYYNAYKIIRAIPQLDEELANYISLAEILATGHTDRLHFTLA